MPWSAIFEKILNGALPVFWDANSGVSLVASLFVDNLGAVTHALEQVGKFLDLPDDTSLDIHEVAAMLRTATSLVSACRWAGILGAAKVHLGLTAADVRQFRQHFVLVDEIMRRGGLTYFNVTAALDAAGIKPEHRFTGSATRPVIRIYGRAAVEAFLDPRYININLAAGTYFSA